MLNEDANDLARTKAVAEYQKMQDTNSTPIERGRFFARLLAERVWPTQSALAAGVGESHFRVSRYLKAGRLPPQIVQVLGEHRITARTTLIIDEIRREIGEAALLQNAVRLGVCDDLDTRSILTALQTDGTVQGNTIANQVRVVSKPDEDYLRIYVPNLAQARKEIRDIEPHLRFLFWSPKLK